MMRSNYQYLRNIINKYFGIKNIMEIRDDQYLEIFGNSYILDEISKFLSEKDLIYLSSVNKYFFNIFKDLRYKKAMQVLDEKIFLLEEYKSQFKDFEEEEKKLKTQLSASQRRTRKLNDRISDLETRLNNKIQAYIPEQYPYGAPWEAPSNNTPWEAPLNNTPWKVPSNNTSFY